MGKHFISYLIRVVLVCSATLIASGCHSQNNSLEDCCKALAPRAMSFDGNSVTIPFQMERHKSPFVEVVINGKGPYLFLVDTGCPYSIIKSSIADELLLPASDEVSVRDHRLDEDSRSAIHVQDLQIGNATFHDLLMFPAKKKELGREDGILGINTFVHCQAVFDFPNREFVQNLVSSATSGGVFIFRPLDPSTPSPCGCGHRGVRPRARAESRNDPPGPGERRALGSLRTWLPEAPTSRAR